VDAGIHTLDLSAGCGFYISTSAPRA